MKKTKEPEMISDQEGMILNFAVRYAIGRATYAPSAVIQYVTPRLPLLNNRTLIVLYNDMQDSIRTGNLGDETIDAPICKRFFESIKAELQNRGFLDLSVIPDNKDYDQIRITNADVIRSMSNKELCKFLTDTYASGKIIDDFCLGCVRDGSIDHLKDLCPCATGEDVVMKWLETEADGECFRKDYGEI